MFGALLLVFATFLQLLESRSQTVGYGGMVGTDHYLATQAGIEILRRGGNAADAALAVQWVLNVVRPFMSGIGGGCFIVYYDSESDQVYTIDGREEAPNAYHEQIFCEDDACFPEPTEQCDCRFTNQTLDFFEQIIGGLTIGVPGTLHAFYNLFKHFKSGKISWQETFEDAISIGRNGFPMYPQFYFFLQLGQFEQFIKLQRYNASFQLYYNTTTREPIANVGELFYNPDLSDTLELLSQSEEQAIYEFYNGTLAQEIVDATQSANNTVINRWGLMTKDDLSKYRSVFREPVVNEIDQTPYVMYGMNMPSSGGGTSSYIMNIVNQLIDEHNPNLSNLSIYNITKNSIYSSELVHTLVSASNIAFADRNYYMADSDWENVPIKGIVNTSYNRARAEEFLSNKKIDTPVPFGEIRFRHEQSSYTGKEYGTAHFTIVDKDNNIASVTTTVAFIFGSQVTVPNRGFILNNELFDFDLLGFDYINNRTVANGPEGGKKLRKTALNLFGLNDKNTLGGKRPRSSMSPTIVFEKVYTGDSADDDDESGSGSGSESSSSESSSGKGSSESSGGKGGKGSGSGSESQSESESESEEDSSDEDENDDDEYVLKPIVALGSPGGQTIINTVLQTLIKILFWNTDVQEAIDAPRVWAFNTQEVRIEPEYWQLNPNLRNELINLGYDLANQIVNSTHGSVSAIKFNLTSGILYGGSDSNRVLEATIEPVCYLNGNNNSDICYHIIYDDNGTINDKSSLTNVLIFIFASIFVFLNF